MKTKIDYAQILVKIYLVILKLKHADEETQNTEYMLIF